MFTVTYDIVTPESAGDGDTAECGHISDCATLRDALQDLGRYADSADTWPVSGQVRWFTNTEYRTDYRTGAVESRSLHLPKFVTPASRRRIARYLGFKVA